jgi:hypothetical protein
MSDRVSVFGVGVSGPLGRFAPGFAEVLAGRGYAEGSIRQQLGLVSQLSRWIEGEGLGVEDLTVLEAERFLVTRRARGVCGRFGRWRHWSICASLGSCRQRWWSVQ